MEGTAVAARASMAGNYTYTTTLLEVLQRRSPNSARLPTVIAQWQEAKLARLAMENRRIEKRDNLWKLAHVAVKIAFHRTMRAPAVQGLCGTC